MAAHDVLTPAQAKFVDAYIANGGNGADAVKAAGYQCKSTAAASVQANRLLKNAKVQHALREARDKATKGFTVTSAWILEQVASIATDKKQMAKDRLKALELLGKHAGTWEPKDAGNGVEVVLGDAEGWSR